MPRMWLAGCVSIALVVASASASLGLERYEDAVGDAIADAPDVVEVEVDEPEGPVLSFRVTFATEPWAAGENGAAMLWLVLDDEPEVTFPELDGFSLMTLTDTLPNDRVMGGHLLAGDVLYWHVVDVAVDGPTVTFRLDRKLLGDPPDLWFRVYSAALHDSLYTEEVDHFPDECGPPALYRLSAVHQ